MLFDADIGNVEDDILEVIVEPSDVLELLPFDQLVASDLFFVLGFESIDKSVLELRPDGNVSASLGVLVHDPPLIRMSIDITYRDRHLLLLGGIGQDSCFMYAVQLVTDSFPLKGCGAFCFGA